MATLAEVERAIATVAERDGFVIYDGQMRLVAERPALPGGGAVVIAFEARQAQSRRGQRVRADMRTRRI